MTRVVGIDLGTSKSVVCVLENGRPRILANAQGAQYTPAVVGFNDDGSVIVGQKAVDRSIQHPGQTAAGVRRRLGTDWTFTDHGKTYTAPQIAACVLRKLKRDAQTALGEEFTDVVLAVPAHLGEAERRATLEACELAGLRALRLVGETSLTALAYAAHTRPDREIALVVDLGAGTFSVALCEIGDGVTSVRSTGGDNTLGGNDWDQRLADSITRRFHARTGVDLSVNPLALQRIRVAAEQTKIELSSAATSTVNLPHIATDGGGDPMFLSENITRADFIELTTDLLDRCRAIIAKALADAGLSMREVNRVIPVGGASRMPAFTALMTELGGEPYRGMHPDESAAIGAALLTGVLTGAIGDQRLLDVPPSGIGTPTGTSTLTPADDTPASTPQAEAPRTSTPRDDQRQASAPHDDGSQAAHASTEARQRSGAAGSAGRQRDEPSPLIIDAAAKHGLGQHVSTHPHRWFGGSRAWIYGIPLAILGVIVIASFITDGAGSALAVAVLFLGVAGLVWLRQFISSPKHTAARVKYAGSQSTGSQFRDAQLSLFEHGAVVQSGGRTHVFRWETVSVIEDITRVSHRTYGSETGVSWTYRCQLTDPSGADYLVTDRFVGAEHWGPEIRQRVTAAQLPLALAAAETGKSLEFGSITLSHGAIRAHNRSVPWGEVQEIRIDKGYIAIRVAGEWLSLTKVAANAIPNVFVFLELAERLRTRAR
ncbi:DUF6585 family protein [Nocardia sp. NPDC056000]|uniref:DUF6585 family protein n=1 Tax=Nocardia sp. NPDC056000 TaxID=3345674 RepID=UPI0035D9653F